MENRPARIQIKSFDVQHPAVVRVHHNRYFQIFSIKSTLQFNIKAITYFDQNVQAPLLVKKAMIVAPIDPFGKNFYLQVWVYLRDFPCSNDNFWNRDVKNACP